MPWLKVGDQAAFHPVVTAPLEQDDADDRLINELFGFVARCAVAAAAHELDYIVPIGTARQIAGLSRASQLIDAAVAAGYFSRVLLEGKPALKLVEEEDLFNMILKDERAWKNQRRNDQRNVELTVPVRLRDGDACRWCSKIVDWNDRKSGRAATYDHLRPGHAATTDTFVVCCKACNSARQDDPAWNGTLRKPPAKPFYGAATVSFLAKYGKTVAPSVARPEVVDAPSETNGTTQDKGDGSAPGPQATATSGLQGNGSASGPQGNGSASGPQATATSGLQGNGSASGPVTESTPGPPRVERPTDAKPPPPDQDLIPSQISGVSDLDMPGRDGTGQVRSGRDGPDQAVPGRAVRPGSDPPRDGTSLDKAPPPSPSQRRMRPRKRKSRR